MYFNTTILKKSLECRIDSIFIIFNSFTPTPIHIYLIVLYSQIQSFSLKRFLEISGNSKSHTNLTTIFSIFW